MIDVTSQFGRLAVQRIARQANDAEQAREAASAALLRPIER
jgi:hypothetical protein